MSSSKEKIKKEVLDEKNFGPLVDKIFQQNDVNNSGYIEKHELADLLNNLFDQWKMPRMTNEQVEAELKRLDKNKDGKISKKEFRVLVKEITLYTISKLEI